MAAAVMEMEAATVSVDEFQALEQKVLQTVELIKMERAARSACEAEAAQMRAAAEAATTLLDERRAQMETMQATAAEKEIELSQLRMQLATASNASEQELDHLRRERVQVRQRVEKMLSTLDELV